MREMASVTACASGDWGGEFVEAGEVLWRATWIKIVYKRKFVLVEREECRRKRHLSLEFGVFLEEIFERFNFVSDTLEGGHG